MKICPKCALEYRDEETRCWVDHTELADAPDPNLGKTLSGKYLVEAKLGEGGMAVVYRARHVLVDRPVAVKILGSHVAGNASIIERFRREAKNAAALAHPHIVEIYDQGETDEGRPYLVMELLSGHSLADRIAQGPIPYGEAAALGLQISEGLARAHDFGVIHRDLKPDNVFVANVSGRAIVKLLDFGIARSTQDSRLTSAGELFGTPQYMAPERLASIDAGASQDLYALGVILFEMITGKLPFDAETLPALFLAHMSGIPPRPSATVPNLPRRFEELILGLLAKTPEDRPVDAHAVIRELATLAPAELVAAPPSAATGRAQVAPTLPPTTLDRWARRTAIFEEMVKRAYPREAPVELARAIDTLRRAITNVQSLRSDALVHQRQLDAIETDVREARGRFGYAMQRVGETLSRARESVRKVESEMGPHIAAESEAMTEYQSATKVLSGFGTLETIAAPTAALADALRQAGETLDRWLRVHATATRARELVEERIAEVKDLDFQVKMLREQVERIDAESAGQRSELEAAIASSTSEVEAMHSLLSTQGTALVDALRPKSELADLFARLANEGA